MAASGVAASGAAESGVLGLGGGKSGGGVMRVVDIEALSPNAYQPRERIDAEGLRELAESIRQSGILQPIAVRRRKQGSEAARQQSQEAATRVGEGTVGLYEIIAGERRWQAAKLAGLKQVPVIVHEATDAQMLELALVENLQREDLNPVERARGYRRFCEEFGLTVEEVARRVGEDRSTVANHVRLLELPEQVLRMVSEGALTAGHGRAILMEPQAGARVMLAELAVREGLSVRRLEEVVKEGRKLLGRLGVGGATKAALQESCRRERARSAHLRDLERRFEDALKTKVTIREGRRKGSGKITIEYYSVDEFQSLMELLGVRGD